MRQLQQERPELSSLAQQPGLSHQFGEDLLQNFARVVFIAYEMDQEREQRLRMFVIEPLQVKPCRHWFLQS